jgi:hypothetical protein
MNGNTKAQPPDTELAHQRADFSDPALDEGAGWAIEQKRKASE